MNEVRDTISRLLRIPLSEVARWEEEAVILIYDGRQIGTLPVIRTADYTTYAHDDAIVNILDWGWIFSNNQDEFVRMVVEALGREDITTDPGIFRMFYIRDLLNNLLASAKVSYVNGAWVIDRLIPVN